MGIDHMPEETGPDRRLAAENGELRRRIADLEASEARCRTAEQELRYRIELEDLINCIATHFVNLSPVEIDPGVTSALRAVAEFMGAERSHVFLLSKDGETVSNTHEWCAAGVKPHIDMFKSVPTDTLPRWKRALLAGEDVRIASLDDLPEEASEEKAFLRALGTRSSIAVPMVYRDSVVGFVGFGTVRSERAWTDDCARLLRLVGELIAAALEHKKADIALQKSEEKFRTLAESVGEGVAAVDPDERFTFANTAADEIFGVPTGGLVGKCLQDFLSEDGWRTVLTETERRRREEIGRYDLEIIRPDGATRDSIVTASPRIDDSGEYAGAAAVFLDITERKRVEKALHESEEKYRSLFEESKDVVYITSRDGRLIDISPSAVSLFGYTRKQLIEIDVHGLYVDAEDRRRFQREIEQSEFVRDFPVRLLNKDGSPRDCLLTSTVRRAHDGSPLGYQGIIRDVTERRRAERVRERERRALRVIADAAVHASDIPDLCDRVLGGFLDILGFDIGTIRLYDPDERLLIPVAVAGLAGDEMYKIEPQSIESTFHTAALVGRTREPIFAPDIQAHEISSTHAERLEELHAAAAICWPIIAAKGDLIAVMQLMAHEPKEIREEEQVFFDTIAGMLSAVIERKRAEEEKDQIQAQLLQAQKMEAVGTLASGVAHDFNNLLTAIQGFAELAMSTASESEPIHSDLEKIRSAAERGAALVRQLLLFSRRDQMQPVPLDLNKTTQGAARMLTPLIGEDIEVSVVLAEDLWPVMADEGNIQQVLMNLALNARDAMPEGGTLTIETLNVPAAETCDAPAGECGAGRLVCLSVRDTGTGMDEATRARIFEPFFSTKGPAKGTGLGLAVVYGIVEQHRGWIDVESAPGKGSTFRVCLPTTDIESAPPRPSPTEQEAAPGAGQRILVVEDEEAVRDLAMTVLRDNGYEVFGASTVAEALGVFSREGGRFDLVFSDVVLPDSTGVQLAERLLGENPGLPVLLSSGHAEDRTAWSEIQTEGLSYIQKPYSLPDLLRTVSSIVSPTGTT
jgi:two-component system cell cycle sensor histidine kinase/response regulator CckA